VTVAGLGDRAEPSPGTARMLGGHQPQVPHELPGMREAPEVAELGDDGGGGDELESAQCHHRAEERVHPPVFNLPPQGLPQSLHPGLSFSDRLAVLGEGHVLGGVREGHPGEVAFVGGRPGGLAAVALAVTQHQRLELLACLEPRPHRIDPRAAQVPDRLVALVRDRDRHEFACGCQACEVERIAPVGLDPLARPARDPRWRHHLAAVAETCQLARQCVTARTPLVHHAQTVRGAQLTEGLRQLRKPRTHATHESRRSATGLGHRDGRRLGVRIQSDKTSDKFLHGLPPVLLVDHTQMRSTCGSAHPSVQPTVLQEADRFFCSTLNARLPMAGHDVWRCRNKQPYRYRAAVCTLSRARTVHWKAGA